jgi:hypothetical protein
MAAESVASTYLVETDGFFGDKANATANAIKRVIVGKDKHELQQQVQGLKRQKDRLLEIVDRFAQDFNSGACVCQPGYGGAGCAPCAVGFYKAVTYDDACLACPTGSTTVFERSVALADCVAAPGFIGDSSACFQQCAAGSDRN